MAPFAHTISISYIVVKLVPDSNLLVTTFVKSFEQRTPIFRSYHGSGSKQLFIQFKQKRKVYLENQ